MSLINDMLRDLDSRNAADSERSGLAHNIRALPGAPEPRRINPVLLALGAAAIGGGAVWFALRPDAAPTPEQAVVPPVAAVPAPAVVTTPAVPEPAAPEPAAEAPMPAASGETAAPEVPVARSSITAPPEAPALRMETAISKPPAKPQAAAKNEQLAKAEATPAPAKTAPPAAPNRAAEVPRSNAAPQISKQPTDASSANERADGEYRRGVAALRRGDAVEGSEALRTALRISPTHVSARQALLAVFTEQQRWADAETLALDGVGLLPQRSDWALLAARLMYERGDAASALTVLDQYASAARQNADYQALRALLLMRAGRNGDAVECYQTALTTRPAEGRLWYGLGRALDADHREALARQAYEKARDSGNLPPELQQAVERRLRQS